MTISAPDFRALCAELIQSFDDRACGITSPLRDFGSALDRARAALATPPPKPPTVMQILELSGEIEDAGIGHIDLVRAALERWGK